MMNILKFKNIVFIVAIFSAFTFLMSSCEKETIANNDDSTQINLDENTQNRYLFEGLIPVDASTTTLPVTDREEVTYFELNKEAIADILNIQPKLMAFQIPTPSQVFELELDKWDITTKDFQVEDENGEIIPFEMNGIFYNGTVKGDSKTSVAVSIFENELSVMILNEKGTRVVKDEEGLMAFYELSAQDYLGTPALGCNHQGVSSSEVKNNPSDPGNIANLRACTFDPIRVRYTFDWSFHQYFNGSFSAAWNYTATRFNEVKTIYNAWNIPVQITSLALLNYGNRLQAPSNTNNPVGDMFSNFATRFGTNSANHWDVNAALVAVDATGGISGPIVGTGFGYVDDGPACQNSAPICKRGVGTNVQIGCRPINIVGLHETSGTANNNYFTYVMGHEIGHNFGISHDYDNSSGDIMDHAAGNQLHIAHTVYVGMYYSWVDCYYTCN